MSDGITRREFVAGTAAAGALAASGCCSLCRGEEDRPDLAVVSGPDIETNTRAAVDALGGMGSFVQSGQTVGILVNVLGAIPAAHTKPEVISAVAAMSRAAGAGDVRIMDWRDIGQWQRNRLINTVEELELNFQHIEMDKPELWRTLEVPRGKALSRVRVFNALYECDVFIMLPIFKHHGGTRYTGALKLYMGTTHRQDNRSTFHRERGKYLEQCIADLNTVVRPPDLILMDAMEVITTRGPVGPGQITTPQKMVAGFDRVAIDAYCAPIQNIDPATSVQITAAHEHGVGEMDMTKVLIKEISAG
jgi:uncharacterized protein (DUF362 family)